MSSRLDPRNYDLSELRDAVRHSTGDCRPDDIHDRYTLLGQTDEYIPPPPAYPLPRPHPTDETTYHSSGTEPSSTISQGDNPQSRPATHTSTATHRRRTNTRRSEATPARDHGARRRHVPRRSSVQTDDLAFFADAHSDNIQRPYLTRLPSSYPAQVEIFDWLETLLETGGPDAAFEALAYYESVGWLSAHTRSQLEDFMDGIQTNTSGPGNLSLDDHRRSLQYIARLAARTPG